MPFVNIKLVKNQVSMEKKKALISGLTDLIMSIMGRDRELTVITVDELNPDVWGFDGITMTERRKMGQ